MPQVTKIRMINPRGRKAARKSKKKFRKNRGATVPKHRHTNASKFVLMGGTPERSHQMAKSRKRKKAKRPGKNYRKGFFAKKSNPFWKKKKGRRARRSNPFLPVTGRELLYVSGGALAGGLGARIIPENTPGISKYNSGFAGYALNLVSGYAVAKAIGWLFGPKAEEGALAGTILMTGSRIVSDNFGRTIVSFGRVHFGYDPAFRLHRMGKYVSAAQQPLSPLPVPTTYPASGPVPPLPVGTSLKALPAATAATPAGTTAAATSSKPLTVAAASSMGYYGASKYGRNRFN